jgi:HSP20 family protein
LTVSSEVVENEGNQDERFARREFERASFSRRFRLSNWVDTQNITAKYEQGVLVIQIPKREEIKSKPIMDITVS